MLKKKLKIIKNHLNILTFKNLKDRFNSSDFIKDVFTLMTGTTVSQIIPLIISPVLTRLYLPEEFGVFAVFTSITSIIAVVSTGRYDFAVMLPKDDREGFDILIISGIAVLITTFVTQLVFILFNRSISEFFNIPGMDEVVYYVPAFILFAGISRSLVSWFNRKSYLKKLALFTILFSCVTAILKVVMGGLGFTKSGLVISTIAGQLILFIIMLEYIIRNDIKDYKYSSLRDLKRTAVSYKDFPQKSVIGAALNMISNYFPAILVAKFFGAETVGLFSLTLKVLSYPMSFIGGAVAQIFYRKATELSRDGNLHNFLKKTTAGLFIIILFPMLIIFLFGDNLFVLIFGEKWRYAGVIAQIMAPYYLVRFVFSSQSSIIMVYRRLDFEIIFNLVLFIAQSGSLFLGFYYFKDQLLSFKLMSFSGVLLYLWLGFFMFREAKRSNNDTAV